jgi:hypothetical protein
MQHRSTHLVLLIIVLSITAIFWRHVTNRLLLNMASVAYWLKDEDDSGLRLYELARQVDMNDSFTRWRFGNALLASNQAYKASEMLFDVAISKPEYAVVLRDAVRAAYDANNAPMVIRIYESLSGRSDNPFLKEYAAWAYLQVGSSEQALHLRPYDLYANSLLQKSDRMNLAQIPLSAISSTVPSLNVYAIRALPRLVQDGSVDCYTTYQVLIFWVWQHSNRNCISEECRTLKHKLHQIGPLCPYMQTQINDMKFEYQVNNQAILQNDQKPANSILIWDTHQQHPNILINQEQPPGRILYVVGKDSKTLSNAWRLIGIWGSNEPAGYAEASFSNLKLREGSKYRVSMKYRTQCPVRCLGKMSVILLEYVEKPRELIFNTSLNPTGGQWDSWHHDFVGGDDAVPLTLIIRISGLVDMQFSELEIREFSPQ